MWGQWLTAKADFYRNPAPFESLPSPRVIPHFFWKDGRVSFSSLNVEEMLPVSSLSLAFDLGSSWEGSWWGKKAVRKWFMTVTFHKSVERRQWGNDASDTQLTCSQDHACIIGSAWTIWSLILPFHPFSPLESQAVCGQNFYFCFRSKSDLKSLVSLEIDAFNHCMLARLFWTSKATCKIKFFCFVVKLFFFKFKEGRYYYWFLMYAERCHWAYSGSIFLLNNNSKHVPMTIHLDVYSKDHKFTESFVVIGCWAFGGHCWLSSGNLREASSNWPVCVKAEAVLWATHFQWNCLNWVFW